jgi:hypothetical protein
MRDPVAATADGTSRTVCGRITALADGDYVIPVHQRQCGAHHKTHNSFLSGRVRTLSLGLSFAKSADERLGADNCVNKPGERLK